MGIKPVRLSLSVIRTDAGTQTRVRVDEQTCADYAEAMIRGDKFPPVVVFQNNGEMILADGFHRVRAARLAKFERIWVEIHHGTRLDALKFSLSANHRHGVRRSNEDKRHAASIALKEFGSLSDGALGEMCGVSQPFVSSVRRQLKTVLSWPKRVGRDGKRRKLPGRSSQPGEPRPLPVAPLNGRARAGQEAAREIVEKFGELETTIRSFLTQFPDKKPIVVGVIRKVKSDLARLEKEIERNQA